MSNPIFDLDKWEPMFPIGNGMAVDSEGNFKIRMGDSMAMDMDTGELSFTTPWEASTDLSDFSDSDFFDDDF